MLGHHYEVEEISDFDVKEASLASGLLRVKATYEVEVRIFLDNEDATSFGMHFPVQCETVFEKRNEREYELKSDLVKVTVDTDEYYK